MNSFNLNTTWRNALDVLQFLRICWRWWSPFVWITSRTAACGTPFIHVIFCCAVLTISPIQTGTWWSRRVPWIGSIGSLWWCVIFRGNCIWWICGHGRMRRITTGNDKKLFVRPRIWIKLGNQAVPSFINSTTVPITVISFPVPMISGMAAIIFVSVTLILISTAKDLQLYFKFKIL